MSSDGFKLSSILSVPDSLTSLVPSGRFELHFIHASVYTVKRWRSGVTIDVRETNRKVDVRDKPC
jgi:hypothetical protein